MLEIRHQISEMLVGFEMLAFNVYLVTAQYPADMTDNSGNIPVNVDQPMALTTLGKV